MSDNEEKIGLLKKKELIVILVFIGLVLVIGFFFAAPRLFPQNQNNGQNNFPIVQQSQGQNESNSLPADNQPQAPIENDGAQDAGIENTGTIQTPAQGSGEGTGFGNPGTINGDEGVDEEPIEDDPRTSFNCIDIEGRICEQGTACSNPTFVTLDTDACCYGECV